MVKVLIAEDDLLIADQIEETLVDYGYEVCGIATTVAAAVALGRLHNPRFAVIDMRLAEGGFGSEIPIQLGGLRKLGVLYATAHPSQVMLAGAKGDACLVKPYRPEDLLRGLEILTDIVTMGQASPPFPPGFQVLRSTSAASYDP